MVKKDPNLSPFFEVQISLAILLFSLLPVVKLEYLRRGGYAIYRTTFTTFCCPTLRLLHLLHWRFV